MRKTSLRILRNSAPLGMVVSAVMNNSDLGDSVTSNSLKVIARRDAKINNMETSPEIKSSDAIKDRIRLSRRKKQIRSTRLRLRPLKA